ncbi:MAG: signal peptidase I [Leptolyngbyaceae cyanobacterium bins.302]|nr:signal peptidase I [Leptolyngbyaceae cyanobacterium bins.302]
MTTLQSSTHKFQKNQWLEAVKTAGCGLALALGLHTFVAEVRYIPSESMTPTLQVGDRLIIEKLSYRIYAPQRRDIVVFKAPPKLEAQHFHGTLIKRIVGIPGDVVAVEQGRVYVNGEAITEPYVHTPANYSYGPVTIPSDQYFVLGDNRTHSYDSHFWGFLPRQNIIGRTIFRFTPLQHLQVF